MALIGVVSTFSSLAVIALASIALKRLFRGETVKEAGPIHEAPSEEETKIAGVAEVGTFKITIDGKEYKVKVEDSGTVGKDAEGLGFPSEIEEEMAVSVDGEKYNVKIEGTEAIAVPKAKGTIEMAEEAKAEAAHVVKAPMRGNVVRVPVKVGDRVERGTVVLVLETMKMENNIESPVSGTVKAVKVSEGEVVDADDVLFMIG